MLRTIVRVVYSALKIRGTRLVRGRSSTKPLRKWKKGTEICMSVKEFEARHETIHTDIELRNVVLKELEHHKIVIKRELNAVRKLHSEMREDIILRCPPYHSESGAHRIPMLFLTICHAWAAIAASIPALWAVTLFLHETAASKKPRISY